MVVAGEFREGKLRAGVISPLWVPNRGKQTAAPLSSKRGTDKSGAFFIEKNSQCMQIFPSRTSRACSLPKQKTQRLCLCHRVSNNEDTDPHTSKMPCWCSP